MTPLSVTGFALASSLGHGTGAAFEALMGATSGLRRNDFLDCALETYIGRVAGVEAEELPQSLARFDSRCSRLAQLGLRQDSFTDRVADAAQRHGPDRVGVFIGTSSSGILEAELGFRQRDPETGALPSTLKFRETYSLYSVTEFVRQRFALSGPSCTVSSACSSSAKVFASAARAIAAGLCDAAVVGGVETLCFTTLHGFAALELLSQQPCKPCDEARNGISIGEAAAFVLLESAEDRGGDLALLGYGESSDAHHMSTPHPEGIGAARAMRAALTSAGLQPSEIEYVNLHGTATRNNDAAEDAAVYSVFGDAVACSATKGWTGHALGASGALEAVVALLCIQHEFIPGTVNSRRVDPRFRCQVKLEGSARPIATAMSNSFGFGGSNCSLIFGKPWN
ncbi:MAG: beta-ketoacyl-[acyl-carrier-protein] synthase family protein [Burkholderiales bacterium]